MYNFINIMYSFINISIRRYTIINISMYLGAIVSSRAYSWFHHRIYIAVTIIAVGERDF